MDHCQDLRISDFKDYSPTRPGESIATASIQRIILGSQFKQFVHRFFEISKFPNLRELVVDEGLSLSFLGGVLDVSNLTTLTVEGISILNVAFFFKTLRKSSALRHLKFDWSVDSIDNPDRYEHAMPVELPGLVTCIVSIMVTGLTARDKGDHRLNLSDSISNVFRTLVMPNVVNFGLEMGVSELLPPKFLIIDSVFLKERNFKNMRDLTIDMRYCECGEGETNTLVNTGIVPLIARLPSLNYLTFSAHKFTQFESYQPVFRNLANLKSLRLPHCPCLDVERFGKDVIKLLQMDATRLESILVDPSVLMDPEVLTKKIWNRSGNSDHVLFY
jgi:hypothetical protein